MTSQERASTPGDQRRLSEFVDIGRCQAISIRNSRQCRHDALPGLPYCPDHYHLRNDDRNHDDGPA